MTGFGEEPADWWRIRRYAVPRWMIERATERRLAGDWRGACAAAHVDVEIDPADLTPEVEDDLRHFAPDLLRWHAPRNIAGSTALTPGRELVLARYGDVALRVLTPPRTEAPQRLRLRVGGPFAGDGRSLVREDWVDLRYLWDARRAPDLLLHRWGCRDRTPYLTAGGVPLWQDELPDPAGECPPDGTAARVEWIGSGLWGNTPRGLDRYRRAGLHEFGGGEFDAEAEPRSFLLRDSRVDPVAFARALRSLRARGVDRVRITIGGGCFEVTVEGLVVRRRSVGDVADLPELPWLAWRLPPDLELLRRGALSLERLHPLVRNALCPARPPADGPVGPPDPTLPVPTRLTCHRERHEITMRDGRLRTPHRPEERDRELALGALGGPAARCASVVRAWENGERDLPPKLREARIGLFLRMHAGDAEGVLALLDAGFDPHVRDARKRTLLHHIHQVDHRVLLPRLLAAGLDVNAEDSDGLTPLHMAVCHHGSPETVRALLEAGSRPDTARRSLARLIRKHERDDLAFLLSEETADE
ncbi:ankyrin repeat domain-containing protein [Actinomadura kijaniata]|uniref:ankyrin repeat domain-containing protein n=1 Tax=Actinomadura kijaniata TaxID=46161 RepID=UPI00082A99B9|nr:ankyrin repeat domain-containing protein [Actinomadura kijaniata]